MRKANQYKMSFGLKLARAGIHFLDWLLFHVFDCTIICVAISGRTSEGITLLTSWNFYVTQLTRFERDELKGEIFESLEVGIHQHETE